MALDNIFESFCCQYPLIIYPEIDAETGQWNGLISNQVRDEVDIGTAALTMCCKRTDAVDYLWPTSVTRESFAIKGW